MMQMAIDEYAPAAQGDGKVPFVGRDVLGGRRGFSGGLFRLTGGQYGKQQADSQKDRKGQA